MPESCIMCSAVASTRLQILYCDACQPAMYCSKALSEEGLEAAAQANLQASQQGDGDIQVRHEQHTSLSVNLKEVIERNEGSLTEDTKRFFKLFEESTFEGSRAAAQKMKKIAKRQTKRNQKFLFLHSFCVLVRCSVSDMLLWPSSPLLVMLQFVDPNVLFGEDETRVTSLHYLADLADPFDYSTHENQLILAKQLIDHGANVNAVSIPHGMTPLHYACFSCNVINLDFVELLLEKDANPNAQDQQGMTPLMSTTRFAPGAAKFLLNWPTTDVNITTRSGASFLTMVRSTITALSYKVALPDNPGQIQDEFQLQQWRAIEDILVERGAAGTGLTTLE
jgi:hypothetical protein